MPGSPSSLRLNVYTGIAARTKHNVMIQEVKSICSRISIHLFGVKFSLRVERDNKRPEDGRIFLQVFYEAFCTKTGELQPWSGRKWYLSDHMTEDEIIKTGYCAFEAAVKHEIMEGFKVDSIVLFNPHVDYNELLKISSCEVKREPIK